MARTLDFKDHRRELDANRYVYAVVSRRARGLSIGLNLNPDKVCNFDCPYCQVDRTTPGGPSAVDVTALVGELDRLLDRVAGGGAVDGAAVRHRGSGPAARGRPRVRRRRRAHDAPRVSRRPRAAVREARDRHGLAVPIRLLTNATMLDRERVRAALAHFDELWCKLDAGTEAYFRKVDGTRFPFARILENLRPSPASGRS